MPIEIWKLAKILWSPALSPSKLIMGIVMDTDSVCTLSKWNYYTERTKGLDKDFSSCKIWSKYPLAAVIDANGGHNFNKSLNFVKKWFIKKYFKKNHIFKISFNIFFENVTLPYKTVWCQCINRLWMHMDHILKLKMWTFARCSP